MKIVTISLLFFLHGGESLRHKEDDKVCISMDKDDCKKEAIIHLCPKMCFSKVFQDSNSDTSLSKLMEPVLKASKNSKMCLKKAKEINKILDNIEEAIRTYNSSKVINRPKIKARSCADARLERERSYGLATVEIFPFRRHSHYHSDHHSDYGVRVLCDQDRDGGGWTVIQMRRDVHHREDFDRPWNDYVEGFGELDGEFWIGLNVMHELTSQDTQELHIELEDWQGSRRWTRYSTFRVGSSSENYKLTISGYTGDAKDAMTYNNGMAFTTLDRDNDKYGTNCAKNWGNGGWWYNACTYANLNGLPTQGKTFKGISWYQWKTAYGTIHTVTMKIRPRHLHG